MTTRPTRLRGPSWWKQGTYVGSRLQTNLVLILAVPIIFSEKGHGQGDELVMAQEDHLVLDQEDQEDQFVLDQ